MLSAKTAFKLIGGASEIDAAQSRIGALSFPLVGCVLGLALVIVNRGMEPYLHSEILAVVLLAVLLLANGGRHLAGTQETFDSLWGTKTLAENAGRRHFPGLVAVLLVVLLKVQSIEVIGESRAISLLLTPLLARWSLVIFLFGSTTADNNTSQLLAENVRPWHLMVATVMSLIFALFIAGEQALWVSLCLSIFALLARNYLNRREGGISPASCGALIELSEALSFALFASL
ncbi:MAG: adenosylcobinamide-GDP ribazoletransferase [Deltaproteobacteria bacterium]|nr:adenosylcobinamide-GDP ribazoletransferase [Deltaproteobacteria bacterium]